EQSVYQAYGRDMSGHPAPPATDGRPAPVVEQGHAACRPAGRRARPAGRAAQPGHHQPGGAVRAPGARAVRLRPRPRRAGAPAGDARPVLDHRPVRRGARHRPQRGDRRGRRGARRAAALGARAGGRLRRQGPGGRGRARRARGAARRRRRDPLRGRARRGRSARRDLRLRDGCRGLHRYAVRRPGQRAASPRDAAPPPAPARAGAGAHRRHAGVRSGARRGRRRRLAVVRPAGRVRSPVLGRRGARLRHSPGGFVTATSPAGTDGGTTDTTPRTGPPAAPGPAHTGSPATRVLGLAALAALALLVLYGLVVSPADREMADSVRLMYVHVPAATLLYVGCAFTTLASAMWLWKRTPGWDALAETGAEVALVFA